ncbi:putative chromosome-partitioning protein ParB [Candidatus Pandoraea novymonadis]|uniref:Chromosome-partitioning protein ParB n=1 Tax=Candidatus Pandoraea novymonadis TaxID=1808959 RepID=A0ABX5FIE2_9BURK|nr:ParB/RepB/Spo0J family partition protein [Candidatus Pandoraea novymonadis]PSB92477.1 putative chromosome-partitioning protein ParB [Candidatus Pandoraea novymonadis]
MSTKNNVRKKKGLGRGLEALFGVSSEAVVPVATESVPAVLELGCLRPGKYQPRTRMDEAALQELAASIHDHGLIQPILVRRLSDEKQKQYEIIAGERRFRAASVAGLSEVPVFVKEVSDEAAAVMALIENMQRENLNPIEEAHGIQRLLNDFNFTHEKAAESLGRSRSSVSNLLRLLSLAQPVQTMLLSGDLDMGHARALLSVDSETQIALANQVINEGLSVRDTECLVNTSLKLSGKKIHLRFQQENVGDVRCLEEELSDLFASTVKIKIGRRGAGNLMIEFGCLDALEGIIARIRAS